MRIGINAEKAMMSVKQYIEFTCSDFLLVLAILLKIISELSKHLDAGRRNVVPYEKDEVNIGLQNYKWKRK